MYLPPSLLQGSVLEIVAPKSSGASISLYEDFLVNIKIVFCLSTGSSLILSNASKLSLSGLVKVHFLKCTPHVYTDSSIDRYHLLRNVIWSKFLTPQTSLQCQICHSHCLLQIELTFPGSFSYFLPKKRNRTPQKTLSVKGRRGEVRGIRFIISLSYIMDYANSYLRPFLTKHSIYLLSVPSICLTSHCFRNSSISFAS